MKISNYRDFCLGLFVAAIFIFSSFGLGILAAEVFSSL